MGIRAKTAFSLTATNITLEGALLSARLHDRTSVLDLDAYLGNKNGSFDVMGGHSFSHSATDISLHGAVLHAKLRDQDGNTRDAVLNLDFVVFNEGGHLRFRRPSRSIELSACCFLLTGSVLEALCLGYDGRLHHSSIDLDQHLANHDGQLVTGTDTRHFSQSGDNFRLNEDLQLIGILENCEKQHVQACFDLTTIIGNRDGFLVYQRQDGCLCDRSAAFAGFCESLLAHVRERSAILELMRADDKTAKDLYRTVIHGASIVGALMGPGPLGPAIGVALANQAIADAQARLAGREIEELALLPSAAARRFASELLARFLADEAEREYVARFVAGRVVTLGIYGSRALEQVEMLVGEEAVRSELDLFSNGVVDSIRYRY